MKIEVSPRFKRDYKRLARKHYDMDKLDKVIQLIVDGEQDTLINQYRDHLLKGEFKGIRECHIEADWLLMYQLKPDKLILYLIRTGSHDELGL